MIVDQILLYGFPWALFLLGVAVGFWVRKEWWA